MSTVNTPRRPWHYTLEDSVYALGAAAREAQRAWKAADLAFQGVDLDRIKTVCGQVTFTGQPTYTPHYLHYETLVRIGDVLLDQEQKLRTLYEQTALAYAFGTAWAIQQVQAGKQPPFVELQRDKSGELVFGLLPLLDLEPCVIAPKLETARKALTFCEDDDSLPDAAYAYGLLAEDGLNFVLIGPKSESERAMLAARNGGAR